MADLFRTLVIAAPYAPAARAIAAAFGPGGEDMWTTGLSPTGAEPVTHYVSSGFIPADFVSLAPCGTWTTDEAGAWTRTDYYAGDAATVAAYATQDGASITEAQIAAIFAASDVSSQEPMVVLQRLGLKIVNPPDNE